MNKCPLSLESLEIRIQDEEVMIEHEKQQVSQNVQNLEKLKRKRGNRTLAGKQE